MPRCIKPFQKVVLTQFLCNHMVLKGHNVVKEWEKAYLELTLTYWAIPPIPGNQGDTDDDKVTNFSQPSLHWAIKHHLMYHSLYQCWARNTTMGIAWYTKGSSAGILQDRDLDFMEHPLRSTRWIHIIILGLQVCLVYPVCQIIDKLCQISQNHS